MVIEIDFKVEFCTVHRKSALVPDIVERKSSGSDSFRQVNLAPADNEPWIDHAR